MKVAILSMQRIENYGSMLQSYGLKSVLENLGCEVEFIDIKKIQEDYDLVSSKSFDFNKEYAERGFTLKKINKYFFIRLRNKLIGKKQNIEFDKFRKKILNLDKVSFHYDLCVIGSDEVFSCIDAGWWGFTSQLFGNVPEADKVITYAASCGATKYENLPQKVKEKISKTFENVEAISVRDNNTKEFTERLTNKKVTCNLDPVLIYNFDNEVQNAVLPKLTPKYCAIYAYVNRIYKEDEVKGILDFCKKHNLTPVTVYGSQFWCKKHIIASPFECLKIFQNADFVITDTFHGAIFSAKYAKKFAVIIRDSNRNKLQDLVKRIGIQKHLLNSINELDKVYEMRKDAETINSILEKERDRSIEYLKEYVK